MSAPDLASVWLLLQTGSRAAAHNMALDDLLLAQVREFGHPILRFYSWAEAAATFGYAQRIAEVESFTNLRPLVRRPTGGGVVPHDRDWTYSLVFPPSHVWYHLKATESYQRVHEWMAAALQRLQISSQLVELSDKSGPGQCFVGAERHDLVLDGRKIAGAAQRRNRDGLLIQGSLQPPEARLAKADWQKAVCDVAHAQWGVQWRSMDLTPAFEKQVEILAASKYSQAAHNRRR